MCRFRASASLRVLTIGLVCWLPAAGGCGAPPPLDAEARQYVRLAVALGERDPDSLDFYAGAADAVADIRRRPPPLAAIRRDAEGLSARLSARHDPDPGRQTRVATLRRDLAAIVARVDLLNGARPRYDEESVNFFGLAPPPLDGARLASIRSQLAAIVGGRGRLVDRYAAFAARFTIPPERLPAVMAAALDECRRASLAHLALPPGEQATLEFVTDKPWSAFSRHLPGGRSVIAINADFRFTVDQALQAACHEGYPGHHARNARSTAAGAPPEHLVQLTFSPESLASEAAAMLAADVAFSADDRLRVVRDRLFPLADLPPGAAAQHLAVERLAGELQIVQADVARRYLDGELEFARAAAALEEQALVPHAAAVLKYINEYRSYVTTYTAGGAAAAARFAACAGPAAADDVRWRCFAQAIVFQTEPPDGRHSVT